MIKTRKETMDAILKKLPSITVRGRSPIAPAGQVHRDKRRTTRAHDRVALRNRIREDY